MGNLDELFEKIASGEIPSYKVYEDDQVFAFLDINPASRGHTLIIPKKRWEYLHELPPEVGAAIGRVLPVIARAVTRAVDANSYNVLSNNGRPAGQVIPHVHFHIIPRFDENAAGGSGLDHRWSPRPIDEEDAKALAEEIAESIA